MGNSAPFGWLHSTTGKFIHANSSSGHTGCIVENLKEFGYESIEDLTQYVEPRQAVLANAAYNCGRITEAWKYLDLDKSIFHNLFSKGWLRITFWKERSVFGAVVKSVAEIPFILRSLHKVYPIHRAEIDLYDVEKERVVKCYVFETEQVLFCLKYGRLPTPTVVV